MSTRENIDSSIEIPSLLHYGETRVIRSHRASSGGIGGVIAVFVMAAIMGVVSGITVSRETSSEPAWHRDGVVPAEVVTSPTELLVERSAVISVSRSARTSLTRAQKIEKVIKFAYAQKGEPYRFGAAGPNRWDCSGLVMGSFGSVGIRLPHYTGTLASKGSAVSRKNLKRGDIVFPQKGHVGIYLGNGMMIHASSGKHKVVVSKMYGFYKARRIIK